MLKEKGAYFEIVFVSSDRDEAAFSQYYETMPWLALPFAQRAVANELKELFEVGGLPTLVIIGPDGKVVTTDGRSMVDTDPLGEKFPWMDMKKPLSATEVKLIRFGCEHTALAAVKESEAGRLSDDKLAEVQEVPSLCLSLLVIIDALPEISYISTTNMQVIEKVQRLVDETPVEEDEQQAAPPMADITLEAPTLPFPNFELLRATGMDKFAGQTANAGVFRVPLVT